MKITEIKEKISENKNFELRDVEYKSEADKKKFGTSFEALCKKNYQFIKVNGLTFKTRRIIEEFGFILFLYNGTQIEAIPEDIISIELL